MHWNYEYEPSKRETTALEEVKEKVVKINEAVRSISDCDISDEVKALTLKELQEKKAKLIALMHQIVDEL